MSINLDLANSANWEKIHQSSREVVFTTPYKFRPLEEIDVSGPLLLNSPIIASYSTCSSAKPTWNTGGWLYQNIRIGVGIGGLPDASATNSRRVPLNKVQLHFWNRNLKNYQLSFKAPKWVQEISLILWQYTGPFKDLDLEAIDLARIDILRTEAKIDALFKDWNQ